MEAGGKKKTRIWLTAGMLLAVICIFMVYGSRITALIFVDEQDVFYGGYNVVKSGDLYSWYLSQHMPVSYYLAAVGTLLGARTVYQFRLFFYGLMTLIWLALLLRHRKHLNPVFLIVLPFIYLFQLRVYSYATSMVSDHWQGIGLIIILLEMLRYGRTKAITLPAAAFVSAGILLSFGSAFLSVYPIFFIFLGVLCMQIRDGRKKEDLRKRFLREDLRLAGICLVPFVLLLAWYAAAGTLSVFFQSAYTLNTVNYAKYASNFNNDAAASLWGVFPGWISYLRETIGQIGSAPEAGIAALVQLAGLAAFTVIEWKRDRVLAATVFVTVLMAGVRGFIGFHSAPYLAACAVPIAACIGEAAAFFLKKRTAARAAVLVPAAAVIVLLAIPSFGDIHNLVYLPEAFTYSPVQENNRELLELATDPGDRIHVGDISMTSEKVMVYGLRLDKATLASSNPWFNEVFGKEELAYLKEQKTKVVILDLDGALWGYRIRDYAPDLVNYIEENYEQIDGQMYIYRDAMPEVRARMKEAGYGFVRTDFSVAGVIPWKSQRPGETDEQFFTAAGNELTACWLMMDTYPADNRAGLTLEIVDAEDGTIRGSRYLAWDEMEASGWTRIRLPAELTAGKQYEIRIRTDESAPYTQMRIYRTLDNTDTEDCYAVVEGLRVNYCYAMKLEYAADDA